MEKGRSSEENWDFPTETDKMNSPFLNQALRVWGAFLGRKVGEGYTTTRKHRDQLYPTKTEWEPTV